MKDEHKDLGRTVATYGISPAALQRAVFVVILSFMFFLAMMFTYYIRQSVVYFMLASAFLVIYLITLFSWVMMRRSVVTLYDNGISFKGRRVAWDDITAIDHSGSIRLSSGKTLNLPGSVDRLQQLISVVRRKAQAPLA